MFGLLTVAYFLFFVWKSRPGSLVVTNGELLICAAHSDDCVIMGAEMAHGVLRRGGRVRIVFLTCSGPGPETEIARIRAEEARAAWAMAGVRETDIQTLGLPQSEVGGPRHYTERDLDRAARALQATVRDLGRDAAVLIPAEGENHTDHRATRGIALSALRALPEQSRPTCYEATEYNAFLSMRQVPFQVADWIFRSVPLLGRLIPRRRRSPGFPCGPAGAVFRDTPERLARKLAMLDAFESQDPALLRSYFGAPTRYRRIRQADSADCIAERSHIGVFGKRVGPGVVVFLLLVLASVAELAATPVLPRVVAAPAAVLVLALSLMGMWRRRLPGALILAAAGTGLLGGLIQGAG